MNRFLNITTFPVLSPAIRAEMIREDHCPECGGELDTGWECNGCGADFRDEALKLVDRRAAS